MVFINDTLSTYGGSITLLLRMFKWLRVNNIDAAMITDSLENREAVEQLNELGIEIFRINIKNTKEVFDVLCHYDDNCKVINFYWDKYLDIECAKKKAHLSFENIMYNIHPAAFDKGGSRKDSALTRRVKTIYYSILDKMNTNDSLVFMDSINIHHTEEYYGRKFVKTPIILHIPMGCETEDIETNEIMRRYNENIIFSASRADFPYKGYLIGLIKLFTKLADGNPSLRLEIVAGGENSDVLERELENVPETIRERIEYKKWMTYDELKREIRKAKIFVGMGTSIIDSARVSVPSIPVLFDTYECLSNGFFHAFGELTSYEDCDTGIESFLQKIINISFDDYKDISELTYKKMVEEYDINKIMQRFITIKTKNTKCILDQKEYLLHKTNNLKNKLLYRKSRFNYSSVK